MTPATYVTINDAETYKLGAVDLTPGYLLGHIQCIDIDTGRVVRVCTFANGWGMGTRVKASGDRLYFHRNGFE